MIEKGHGCLLGKSEGAFSKLFLLMLKLAVYSKSTFLTMTTLALYGLITGVAYVPRKRLSAVKSLLVMAFRYFNVHWAHKSRVVQKADKDIARKPIAS